MVLCDQVEYEAEERNHRVESGIQAFQVPLGTSLSKLACKLGDSGRLVVADKMELVTFRHQCCDIDKQWRFKQYWTSSVYIS